MFIARSRQTSLVATWLCGAALSFGCSVEHPAELEAAESTSAKLTCSQSFSRTDRVERGLSVATNVHYSPDTGFGSVNSRIENSHFSDGDTVGVIVVAVDDNALPIFATDVQTFGIDACFFRCPRRRTVTWSFSVPADVRARVAGISILQTDIKTRRALFRSLTFARYAGQACAAFIPAAAPACKAVSSAIAVADPALQTLVAAEREEVVDDLLASSASAAQFFQDCPPPGPITPPECTDGAMINCQRPDGTGSYKVCSGGTWGTCI